MRQNPFYGLSVAAMLGGCFLLNHALKLEPGHLGKLVTLIAVLQVYEALLVGLGVFLVTSGRARRDGVMVLMLETLFLVDAPLLAMECVTADTEAGTFLSLVLVGLAAGKLALVHRALPDLLPTPVAVGVWLQALLILELPVVAVRIADARLLNPISLYGLWWLTLALPLVQAKILDSTVSAPGRGYGRGHEAWTWLPALSVMLHLWSIGWIHQVPFRFAYLAPLWLGLALATRREEVGRQVVYPALAILFSLGQSSSLGQVLTTPTGAPVSALKLALAGAGATCATLAWRHGYRWLVALAGLFGVGALGGVVPNPLDALGSLMRFVGRAVPRTVLGWGVAGVVSSFLLLALGIWRSLGGSWPGTRASRTATPRGSAGQGLATLVLFLGFLSTATAVSAYGMRPYGRAGQGAAIVHAALLAVVALVMGLHARSRLSALRETALRTAASLGIAASVCTLLMAAPIVLVRSEPSSAAGRESGALGDVRTVISAQAAYAEANRGYPAGNLACLAHPAECIPGYSGPAYLPPELAEPGVRGGYRRSFHPGPPVDTTAGDVSPTSVGSFAYVAVPDSPGLTGFRAFCGDATGQICFTADGSVPDVRADGTCNPVGCTVLE